MNALSDRALVFALADATELVDPELCSELRQAGATTLQVNVCDVAVRAGFRLATLEPPVDAVVTMTGEVDVERAREVLAARGRVHGAWWTEVEVPLEPAETPQGQRLEALAQVALLRRPGAMDEEQWLHVWKAEHTPVALETQASSGYVQHRVLEPALPGSPEIAAVVEEHFSMEAVHDPHAFYGSGGDQEELDRRMTTMVASVQRFGADKDLDVVPTSRYRWVFPSTEELTSRP